MRKRSNLPLKGDKESLYEGGIRGVGFVMSPLIEKPKREYNQYDKYHISIQSFILFFTTSSMNISLLSLNYYFEDYSTFLTGLLRFYPWQNTHKKFPRILTHSICGRQFPEVWNLPGIIYTFLRAYFMEHTIRQRMLLLGLIYYRLTSEYCSIIILM